MAGNSQSFRHGQQLPFLGIYLSPLLSYGSGHGWLSSGLGWTAAVHLSTFCADPSGPEQADVVHGESGTYLTIIAPFSPQREWFPVLQSRAVAPLVLLPTHRDLLRQSHFHRLHQNLHMLNLHVWRLFSSSHAT